MGECNEYYKCFLDVVHRAEALEFLVRVTYYVYKVWQLIKGNEVPKFNPFFSKPFDSNYSFKFANQLMTDLQVSFKIKKNGQTYAMA